MANDFQLHTTVVGASATVDVVPDAITAIGNTAQAVVHAIYLQNNASDTDTTVDLFVTDNANTPAIKSYILRNIDLPRASTISVEKPINLPQSTNLTSARKLRVTSGGQVINVTASVLVIT